MGENVPIWLLIITTILSAIGGGFGTTILAWFKQRKEDNRADLTKKSELQISENAQAIGVYKDIITLLKEDLSKLEEHLKKIETEYMASREENIKLRIQNDNLIQDAKKLEDFFAKRARDAALRKGIIT